MAVFIAMSAEIGANQSFLEIYRGRLEGILDEDRYLDLADLVRGHWYALAFTPEDLVLTEFGVGDENSRAAADQLLNLHREIRERRMALSKFPFTYVRDADDPTFIKLYDPLHCSACGTGPAPEPWWVFSRVRPLESEINELREERKRHHPHGFLDRLKRRLARGES